MSKQQDYYEQVYSAAKNIGLSDIAAHVAASQSSLESGYGKSVKGNNFFGIKAGKSWKGDTQVFTTHEEENGVLVKQKATFRKYNSPEESLADWKSSMERLWPDVLGATTLQEAYIGLDNGRYGKYASSSRYKKDLASITRHYGQNASTTALAAIEKAAPNPAARLERADGPITAIAYGSAPNPLTDNAPRPAARIQRPEDAPYDVEQSATRSAAVRRNERGIGDRLRDELGMSPQPLSRTYPADKDPVGLGASTADLDYFNNPPANQRVGTPQAGQVAMPRDAVPKAFEEAKRSPAFTSDPTGSGAKWNEMTQFNNKSGGSVPKYLEEQVVIKPAEPLKQGTTSPKMDGVGSMPSFGDFQKTVGIQAPSAKAGANVPAPPRQQAPQTVTRTTRRINPEWVQMQAQQRQQSAPAQQQFFGIKMPNIFGGPNGNIGKAPTALTGHQSGGSHVSAVTSSGISPATLVSGGNYKSFDNEYHQGQNMDVYRANRDALGGNVSVSAAKEHIANGGTLYKP